MPASIQAAESSMRASHISSRPTSRDRQGGAVVSHFHNEAQTAVRDEQNQGITGLAIEPYEVAQMPHTLHSEQHPDLYSHINHGV